MPNYYNPGLFYPATYQSPYMQQQPMMSGASNTMQYMINVDGEGSARAWQPPQQIGPNTIIPLWDLDGIHLYFKSTDAYGRMNPIRKARVVFEDEPQQQQSQQVLPQGQSGAAQPVQQAQEMPDMSQYVTKKDLDSIHQEILGLRSMFGQRNNQNRNNSNDQKRGDDR